MKLDKNTTAVGYLVKELSAILGPLETKPMQDLLMVDAINKAKQMEKEQIVKAHLHGVIHKFDNPNDASDDYYNDTFGDGV